MGSDTSESEQNATVSEGDDMLARFLTKLKIFAITSTFAPSEMDPNVVGAIRLGEEAIVIFAEVSELDSFRAF